jgi:hypothetical protein
MTQHRKLLFTWIAVFLLSLTVARIYGWDADDEEEDKKAAVTVPSHVSVQNGRTVITLDAATQQRMGLATAVVHSSAARAEAMASAMIIPAQELLTLRSNYVAAQSQLQKAQASASVSEQEYQRLKNLYNKNQDASQKSVEAAQGVFRTDFASLSAAQHDLALQKFAVQQNWGPAIAGWIADGSKELDDVLSQNLLLVQVTLPPENAFDAPQRILLSTASGELLKAQYISPLPRTSPLIQRASLLYSILFRPSLAPGMNLVARLPEGPARNGLIVPYSAIVWQQGQAWAYLQVTATQFTRKPVSTDTPLSNGYFITRELKPGDRILIRGAQFLLSEEFRSQIQPEG